jgi:hypothetical protein
MALFVGRLSPVLAELVTCDFVVLGTLFEFAESSHGQTLSRGALLDGSC